MEITLSTGKKVTLRQKKGQHHFIERNLLAACAGEGGQNIGGMALSVAVQTIVSIEAIDGEKVDTPTNLAGVYEFMDQFTYQEWNELEMKSISKEDQEKIEAAKNLLNSPGSVTE
ncbi:hypothetical protein [Brevibacillus massiliensis]|uniref:hypothetical protein n=1 Tax=Brevibacillus massiliensis TaxID=1118054 RepID=UPI0003091981|nr:hypothetical protein [Brevibacillus massiliensis]